MLRQMAIFAPTARLVPMFRHKVCATDVLRLPRIRRDGRLTRGVITLGKVPGLDSLRPESDRLFDSVIGLELDSAIDHAGCFLYRTGREVAIADETSENADYR